MQQYLVPATLFARRARNIRNSTPRINNESKHLRRSTDPKPRCVIPTPINQFRNQPTKKHKTDSKLIGQIEKEERIACMKRFVYPLRRRSSWSLMRALGWRLDSDPWSWRRGSSSDVDELGAERYNGRTIAGREPWWRFWRIAASPPRRR